jgi:hypothetical protein
MPASWAPPGLSSLVGACAPPLRVSDSELQGGPSTVDTASPRTTTAAQPRPAAAPQATWGATVAPMSRGRLKPVPNQGATTTTTTTLAHSQKRPLKILADGRRVGKQARRRRSLWSDRRRRCRRARRPEWAPARAVCSFCGGGLVARSHTPGPQLGPPNHLATSSAPLVDTPMLLFSRNALSRQESIDARAAACSWLVRSSSSSLAWSLQMLFQVCAPRPRQPKSPPGGGGGGTLSASFPPEIEADALGLLRSAFLLSPSLFEGEVEVVDSVNVGKCKSLGGVVVVVVQRIG